MISDNMKKKISAAITKAGKRRDFKTIDMLEKMIAGSAPVNYALIDRVLKEEENSAETSLDNNRQVLSDLQRRLSQANSEEERRSLQLRMDVVQAKINELQNKTATENMSEAYDVNDVNKLVDTEDWVKLAKELYDVYNKMNIVELKSAVSKLKLDPVEFTQLQNAFKKLGYLKEDAPYQKIHFLDTDNNGNTIFADDEAEEITEAKKTWKEQRADMLRKRIKNAMKNRDMTKGDARAKWQSGINQMRKELKKVLAEGCMTKKFEGMSNRQVADYIFRHPHTKFASKMKECDDKEIMKAFRSIKNEEATGVAAVANPELPMNLQKRKI